MSPQAKASSGGDIVPEMAIKQSDELPRHAGVRGPSILSPAGKPSPPGAGLHGTLPVHGS